ncbi:hypothetical protein [Streptomyces canus]|nr:hypothetical protein [Streptomyces canus]
MFDEVAVFEAGSGADEGDRLTEVVNFAYELARLSAPAGLP